MRIALVTVGLGLGGAERLIVDLAGRLVAVGDEVTIVSMLDDGPLADQAAATGATVVELGFRRGRPSLAGWYRFVRALRAIRPDVVHASMFHANVMARLTRLLIPVPCVISSAHNVNERGDADRRTAMLYARERLYRLTDRLSEMTSQVSPLGAADYVERGLVSAERMQFVPNGIDVDRFVDVSRPRDDVRGELGVETNRRVFLTVGAMTHQKNHLGLIDAFESVADVHRNVHLVIVGDGPLRDDIERRVREGSAGARVTLTGARFDVPELLAASDVFVLPSRFEGMPLVLLEALAAGLPTIATAVGAVPEVFARVDAGWLVAPDSGDELVEALDAACRRDEADLVRQGEAAQAATVEQFGIDAYARRWRELYERLASNPRLRTARPAGRAARDIWG